jgi:hypothetical protein
MAYALLSLTQLSDSGLQAWNDNWCYDTNDFISKHLSKASVPRGFLPLPSLVGDDSVVRNLALAYRNFLDPIFHQEMQSIIPDPVDIITFVNPFTNHIQPILFWSKALLDVYYPTFLINSTSVPHPLPHTHTVVASIPTPTNPDELESLFSQFTITTSTFSLHPLLTANGLQLFVVPKSRDAIHAFRQFKERTSITLLAEQLHSRILSSIHDATIRTLSAILDKQLPNQPINPPPTFPFQAHNLLDLIRLSSPRALADALPLQIKLRILTSANVPAITFFSYSGANTNRPTHFPAVSVGALPIVRLLRGVPNPHSAPDPKLLAGGQSALQLLVKLLPSLQPFVISQSPSNVLALVAPAAITSVVTPVPIVACL